MTAQQCDYCGLPVSTGKPLAVAAPIYCCYGCRIAASIAGADDQHPPDQARNILMRLGVAVFFAMNVMVFTLALWSWDVYEMDAASEAVSSLHGLLRYACLLFSVPVFILLGLPLLQDTWGQLRQRRLSTDVLLIMGVLASFAYSLVSLLQAHEHVYFEVGCMVLVAVTLGRWLEAAGKLKTTQGLRSLSRLLPDSVRRVSEGTNSEEIEIGSARKGDKIRVLAGERIPIDGRILSGRAAVDEQLITGESQPVVKSAGDDVYGGSLNLDGDLITLVQVEADEGTLPRLIRAVTEATASRGREQLLADQVAGWFMPAVFALTVVTFVYHSYWSGWGDGIMNGLAVVLIACPCALAVATPLAVWSAMGHAAQQQVLFRDGDALSRMARIRAVCFDKTGTLTSGTSDVKDLIIDEEVDRGLVLRVAAAVASGSRHAFAIGIVRCTRLPPIMATGTEVFVGRGLAAFVRLVDDRVALGSQQWMDQSGFAWPPMLRGRAQQVLRAGSPIVCVAWQDKVRGFFVMQEHVRPTVCLAMQRLRELGLHLKILSGDESTRTQHIGKRLSMTAHGGLLPAEKREFIRQLRQRLGPVAMVGDGINDAPALAEADVGIAMGCGADVTRDAGDVCLLSDDPDRLCWSIELAQRTVRTIRQNLFWAFAYNLVGVGIAAVGLLNPLIAAGAMVGSSLVVVTNSLRLAGPTEELAHDAAQRPTNKNFGNEHDKAPIYASPMERSPSCWT